MAKKKKPAGKEKKKKKKSKKLTLVMILLSLGMVVVFKIGFLFFIIGILPSIVSYYVDATRNNLSFHTVFSCNLAGIMPFMAEMLRNGGSNAAAQAVLSDSLNWLVVYGGAGLGWGLVFIGPIIAQQLINTVNSRQTSRLKKQQRILLEQWGDELEDIASQA
jgi:hypothetical protein